MTVLRILMVFLLFSALLVGCKSPFISIDIKTGGETVASGNNVDDPDTACRKWLRVCPGYKIGSIVTHIQKINKNITLYIVKSIETSKSIHVPPSQVSGTVAVASNVQVETLDDGTYKIIGP